jgi:serine/threonine-protein kinase
MVLTPERWKQIEAAFDAVIDHPPAGRDACVARLCGDDLELRREVEELLRSDLAAGAFLDPGALGHTGPAAPASRTQRPPADRVGHYRVLHKVGEGGMSSVWAAAREDAAFEKQVAVKFFRPELESPALVKRFHIERQILAGLDHPFIAKLLDGGSTADGIPYLVMDYVDGLPIDEYCDRRRLGLTARLELFRKVCAAVQHAHANLVVHRDIKPSNILVRDDGEPKLLDFGIAKLLNPDLGPHRPEPTRFGAYAMTPEYASPEQARGEPVTTRADVYSLGVLLYKLLVGCLPYELVTRSLSEAVRTICEEEPVRPSQRALEAGREVAEARGTTSNALRRALAGDLDNIARKALRKEPERRYASVERLAEDVERHLEGRPVLARPDTLAYRSGKFVKRHRIGVAVGTLAAAALLTSAVTLAVQSARLRSALGRAEAVTRFLQETLGSANPYGGVGRDATVVEVLERTVAKIDASFAGQPETEATVRATVGATFRDLGRYDEARPLLEKALATRRRVLGPHHPDVATSLLDLGELLQQKGELAPAEALGREALAIMRGAFGPDSLEAANALSEVATILRKKGDYDQAEADLREALDILRGQLPGDDPRVARILRMLGSVLHDKGDYAGAEPHLREALDILRRKLPESSAEITVALREHAVLLTDKGDFATAEPIFRQILDRQRARLGDEHSIIAESLTNLARVVGERGDLKQAASLQGRALEIFRKVYGEESAYAARAATNLGIMLLQSGEHQKAREHLESALLVSRKVWGPAHQHTAMVLENLGYLCVLERDYPQAERHFRAAWDIMRSTVGETHPEAVNSLNSLAYTVWQKGERKAAAVLFMQALGLYGRMKSPNRFYKAVCQSDFGALLTELERYEEARQLLEEAFRTFLDTAGPKSEQTKEAASRLALLGKAWRNPRFDAALAQLTPLAGSFTTPRGLASE